MTDADKASVISQSTTFWSDAADFLIRIWINQESRIQIPDHYCLRLDALALSGHSLVVYV